MFFQFDAVGTQSKYLAFNMIVYRLITALVIMTVVLVQPLLADEQVATGPAYQLHLKDKALLENLKAEIQRQRTLNTQLRQFNNPRKFVNFERELLLKRLRAQAYYGARIESNLHEGKVQYYIEPGVRYKITKIQMKTATGIQLPGEGILGVKVGDALVADEVLKAEERLKAWISENHCLFTVSLTKDVRIYHASKQAELDFILADSPLVNFGLIELEGLVSIEEGFLRKKLPVKQDECFSRRKLDDSRLALLQSNLIANVSVALSQPEEGKVNVTFVLTERHHRTLAVGLGYQDKDGAGISLGWEHRNIFHAGQKLEFDSYLAQRAQTLEGRLIFPDIWVDRQELMIFSKLEQEERVAFDSRRASTGVLLSRALRKHLKAGIGLEFEHSRITDRDETNSFSLLSIPLTLEYDKRNNILNPKQGWLASAQVRPYKDISSNDLDFVKTSGSLHVYHTLKSVAWQPTLALRASSGWINQAPRPSVPANIRFYSGGGGSVRGYNYQTLGPLDEDNVPLGGLSFTELSSELRLQFSEQWGMVFFLDGGYAYENQEPALDEDLLWGAGVGLRYYTSFAPLRLDLGFPLDKREGLDDDYQLYISIGQAF